jgi:sugar/nucleoside kinase (ribokinase family)
VTAAGYGSRPVDTPLDVVGVGNALVDVLSFEAEEFLADHGLSKGAMTLIDADRAEMLYADMGVGVEMSGGSAANTLAGVASLGGRGGFIGRVRDDELGKVFAHDIRAVGVEFAGPTVEAGPPTGRCLIVVTPDGERTMNTLLGAASELAPEDIDPAFVTQAKITYLEGYLFDQDAAGEAFHKASAAAHDAGRLVALTLSDSFCVERYLEAFRELVADRVDVLFGNEHELTLLFETDDVEEAVTRAEPHCDLVAVTLGSKGALVSARGRRVAVPAAPVERVVDTTGAGDLFAAGFLYGLSRDRDAETCGRLGAIAAAEAISHMGARPEASLAALAAPVLT